jgi:hypothetical protein
MHVQAHLGFHLKMNRGQGKAVPTISLMLQWLVGVNELSHKVHISAVMCWLQLLVVAGLLQVVAVITRCFAAVAVPISS